MGGMLYVFVTGSGRYSLDAALAKRRERERYPPAIIESVLTIGAYQRAVGKPVTITNAVCDLTGMSAIGTKRTSACALHMSAFGGKADITLPVNLCLLLTQSGHLPL